MDSITAERLGLKQVEFKAFEVILANREKLQAGTVCTSTKMVIQGHIL